MDSPEPQSQGGDAETPSQKQTRLRRERREAKIQAGGSARLEKITNLSGRQNLPGMLPQPSRVLRSLPNKLAEFPPVPAPTGANDDPDEVDLSTHPSAAPTPNTNTNSNDGAPSQADIRALLRSQQPGGEPQQQQGEEDPMMKMLQQMMGVMPGADGQQPGEGDGGLPPGLAAMLGAGGMAGIPGMGPAAQKEDTYGYLWKIVHAVFALVLGIYVTATSHAFTGGVTRGEISGAGHEGGVNVFWVFATAELVLQSSRFFLEKGRSSSLGGWIGIVGNMLPEPWKGYLTLAARYSGIWSTVVEDGMVIVFVVGLVAWWKGAVG